MQSAGTTKRRKACFFEKKKQKTFIRFVQFMDLEF